MKKLYAYLLIASCYSTAYAQVTPNYEAGPENVFAGYGKNARYAVKFFDPTYGIAQTMIYGRSQMQVMPPLAVKVKDPGTKTEEVGLINNPQEAIKEQFSPSPMDTWKRLINQIPDPVVAKNLKGENIFIPQSSSDDKKPVDAATYYNFDSFFNQAVYADNGKTAKNYLQFVSQLSDPIDIADLKDKRYQSNLSNPSLQKYIILLRNYIANQSVGLSNLYQIYMDRLPKKDILGKSGSAIDVISYAGNAKQLTNVTTPSPQQLDQYAATRRLNDENWYSSMESASSVTVAKETLYLLAEMRLEMYKTRMALERMNATLSVMQLQRNREHFKQTFIETKQELDNTSK